MEVTVIDKHSKHTYKFAENPLESIERIFRLIVSPLYIFIDKKFIGNINRLVLIKGIGKTVIRTDLPLSVIRDSLTGRLNP